MEKRLQIVNYEQAQRLKKAGFDWYVPDFYVENPNDFMLEKPVLTKIKWDELDTTNIYYAAPTVALALKWFRGEKKIPNAVCIKDFNWEFEYYYIVPSEKCDDYDTYEAAESALLDELLNILEENPYNN